MTFTGTAGEQAATDAGRAALSKARGDQVALVRFLYVDHGGIVRGKSSSLAKLPDRLNTGIGHTLAMMAMTMMDTLQPVDGMGPVGEVRMVPDPATYVTLPFTVGKRETDPSGGPDVLAPIDDSLCYSATGFHQAHDFVIELMQAFEAQNLQVEHYYPELGAGQHEVSIRHAPALRAADNQVLYRETVRGVAFRRGLWASLAPKPIADGAGNGTHLHGSLHELGPDGAPGTRNLFNDPGDRYGLSEIGYHFIAGIRAHLPALTALTCASVNSYRRLTPRAWSSAYTVWGMDNREAAIRICSPLRGDESSSVNLELKASDSTGNPYLALGGFIQAGLDGIRGKLDPGEAVNVDPAALSEAERQSVGARRLPASLGEALDALERDDLLMDALGALRRTAYLAVKRAEVEAFAGQDAAYECFHYFTKI